MCCKFHCNTQSVSALSIKLWIFFLCLNELNGLRLSILAGSETMEPNSHEPEHQVIVNSSDKIGILILK